MTLRGPEGERVVEADWFVDATETGELLPLAGAEHVTGAESREQTGEPHAAAVADPLNMQPVSACFAVDHLAGEDHTIPRPPGYDAGAATRSLAPDPRTNELVAPHARRRTRPATPALIGPDLADPVARQGAVAVPADRGARELRARPPAQRHHARQLAADRLHGRAGVRRARRRAPRRRRARAEPRLPALAADRGGLPGLRLRGDVVGGTPDGLAKALYIRESRRIVGERPCRRAGARHAPTRTASGSASTGSTCTPRPAATRTSTSPARRSRSRSAR